MVIQDQTKDFGKSLTSFRTIVLGYLYYLNNIINIIIKKYF